MLSKFNDMSAKLRAAKVEIAALTDTVNKLTKENQAKEKNLRSVVTQNVHLQMRIHDLGRSWV